MQEDGPVRQVLRASQEFDRTRAESWRVKAARHNMAGGFALATLLAFVMAFWTLWSLAATLPLMGLCVAYYRRASADEKRLLQETEESFTRYRTVLEDALTVESKRYMNGSHHPLAEQGGPLVQR